MECPVDNVLVIASSEDVLDYELPGTRDNHRLVAEISVFEQKARVFLVDADCILDLTNVPRVVGEVRVEVVDGPFAVTTQCQTVGQIAGSVLTEVKLNNVGGQIPWLKHQECTHSVFPMMGRLRVAAVTRSVQSWKQPQAKTKADLLRHHHLRQRQPVEYVPLRPFVIVHDVVQHDSVAVVEAL